MLTRREFAIKLAVAAAALKAVGTAPGALWANRAVPEPGKACREVVSFHLDRPYIDRTGRAKPYCPPPGARSAEPAARLNEEAFRRIQCYA